MNVNSEKDTDSVEDMEIPEAKKPEFKIDIPQELTITGDEFIKLFPPTQNCKNCYGRGCIKVYRGFQDPRNKKPFPIRGISRKEGKEKRLGAEMKIDFCGCVLKKYRKWMDMGGEQFNVVHNPEVTGKQAPDNERVAYVCGHQTEAVTTRQCFNCFIEKKRKDYPTRAACIKDNAQRIV